LWQGGYATRWGAWRRDGLGELRIEGIDPIGPEVETVGQRRHASISPRNLHKRDTRLSQRRRVTFRALHMHKVTRSQRAQGRVTLCALHMHKVTRAQRA
jgi:hypothetical protein